MMDLMIAKSGLHLTFMTSAIFASVLHRILEHKLGGGAYWSVRLEDQLTVSSTWNNFRLSGCMRGLLPPGSRRRRDTVMTDCAPSLRV